MSAVIVWRVSGPRWTFAVMERGGLVVDAAPLSAWAVGKPIGRVLAWWTSKGADSIERLA